MRPDLVHAFQAEQVSSIDQMDALSAERSSPRFGRRVLIGANAQVGVAVQIRQSGGERYMPFDLASFSWQMMLATTATVRRGPSKYGSISVT